MKLSTLLLTLLLTAAAATVNADTITVPAGTTVKVTIEYTFAAGTTPLIVTLPSVGGGVAPAPIPTPTPTPTPTPLPIPAPTPTVPTPQVSEFRDSTQQFAISSLPGGAAFWVSGLNFGKNTGSITVGGVLKLPVLSWSDTWIKATAPTFVAGQNPQQWTITRADGNSTEGYHSFLGPAITQPAAAP